MTALSVRSPTHLIAIILTMIFVASCAAEQGVSCTTSVTTSMTVGGMIVTNSTPVSCAEQIGADANQANAFAANCPNGVFADSLCSRVNVIGGCEIGSTTTWFYSGVGGAPGWQAQCAADHGRWVTP